jgi:hypothetical protein
VGAVKDRPGAFKEALLLERRVSENDGPGAFATGGEVNIDGDFHAVAHFYKDVLQQTDAGRDRIRIDNLLVCLAHLFSFPGFAMILFQMQPTSNVLIISAGFMI